MHLAALLAQHVLAHDSSGAAGSPADAAGVPSILCGLEELGRAVAAQAASCSAVAILLPLPFGAVTVGVPTERPGPRGPVLASMAVPLLVAGEGALLVLQATDAGAFLLLSDELQGQLEGRRTVVLDQHLDQHLDTTGPTLAAGLADLRVVEQAVGALLEQGWSPDEARDQLRARAEAEHRDVPDLAQRLVADLRRPSGAGDV